MLRCDTRGASGSIGRSRGSAGYAARLTVVLAAFIVGLLSLTGTSAGAASIIRHPEMVRGALSTHPQFSAIPHSPAPLNLAYTETYWNYSLVPQVASATPSQPMYYPGQNSLSVNWSGGSSGNVDLQPGTPIAAGATYDLSDTNGFNAFSSVAGGDFPCSSTNSSVDVTIDQLVTDNADHVLSLAMQFDCSNDNGYGEIYGTIAYNATPSTPGEGYYLYGGDGSLAGFGNDEYLNYLGDLTTVNLNKPVVGMATTPDDAGYWMVAGDGGVFAYGDAGFYGSTGNLRLNKPVLGMAATHDGLGYWFVASDGGIFSYGDAQFYGSEGGSHLNKPIVGMAATPDGKGYWLVASDGGIFTFGDAQFYGSMGGTHLNQPIVGMAATPDGKGYWLVASDGGIFTFGDARFFGSEGGARLNSPIVGMTTTPDGGGYWFTASDGGVFTFGDATFEGSLGGQGINNVAGMSR